MGSCCSLCLASLSFMCEADKKQMHTIVLHRNIIALLLPTAGFITSSHAQVKCTMPNGVVITQQLGDCPRGAVKAQTADGQPLPIPPPLQAARPEPKTTAHPSSTQPASPTRAPAAAPAQPSAYDYAHLICKAFEQSGATTCDVNSNMLSDSTIETTLATSPASAVATCKDVAASMRAKSNAFQGRNWKILIYSPFSGNRPIASCKL